MDDDFLRAAISFFAIIDPIGNLLVFALLSRDVARRDAVLMAVVSTVVAMITITVFVFGGNDVLEYLDISPESFQIAAGALLLFPAYRLVERGDPWTAMPADAEANEPLQFAFVPLAIPLISGPGALATAVSFADSMGRGTTLAAAGVVLAATLAAFLAADVIVRLLGGTTLRVAARLVGVLLMAIAVDLIVGGLDAVFA